MNEVIKIRDAEIIAAEIEMIKAQTRKIMLASSVEIGRRLEEAKTLVPHGNWANWLKEKVNYSQSTAENLMRISKEYGDEQVNLFSGEAKSQTFANLTYSQAVALFALPSEERADFVQENDIENMTSRQLQDAIKEKQAAEKENRTLRDKLDGAYLDIDRKNQEIEKIKKEIAETEKAASGPSPEEIKKLRVEVKEKIEAKYQKESKQLTLDKNAAEEKSQKIEEEYKEKIRQLKLDNNSILLRQQEAEKKLKIMKPGVEKFSAYFDNHQESYNKMKSVIEKLKTEDPETADRLKNALKVLTDGYSKELNAH